MTRQPQNKTDQIIKVYDLFLVDILGIIHDGHKPIGSGVAFVNRLTKTPSKRVIFVSNAPRLEQDTRKALMEKGVVGNFDVMTSGEATRYFLSEYIPAHRVYHFGAQRNEDLLKDHPQKCVKHPKDADLILLSAYLEENENEDDFRKEFETVVASGKKIICVNPDHYATFKGTRRRVAGYIAQMLKAEGCNIHYIGKPDPFIYELTFDRFRLDAHPKTRTIMIGDTLETDIAGAATFGISSALILTGTTGYEISTQPEVVKSYLLNKNPLPPKPTYVLKSL